MPKMKTKSAAKKRFWTTGSGKVKAKQAATRHLMQSKPKKMKRQARGSFVLFEGDAKIVLDHYIPYARSKNKKARRLAAKRLARLNATQKEAA